MKRRPAKMTGIEYVGSPPGYLTTAEAAEALGMATANFHATGLAHCLDRWLVPGPANTPWLYRVEDVDKLHRWLTVRRGLIVLGVLRGTHPMRPTDAEFDAATETGEFDAVCSRCGNEEAVAVDGRGEWCPVCDEAQP